LGQQQAQKPNWAQVKPLPEPDLYAGVMMLYYFNIRGLVRALSFNLSLSLACSQSAATARASPAC